MNGHFRSLSPAGLLILVAAVSIGFGLPAQAQSFEYAFGLEKSKRVAYDMELEAVHPGLLEVQAIWPGIRVLSFKLRPAVGVGGVQRSGRSPQTIFVEVDDASEAQPSKWILSIRGVPARDVAEGTLRIQLPMPQEELKPTESPTQPDENILPPSTFSLPSGASPDLQWFSSDTDRFRKLLKATQPDACRWQSDFLAFLESSRQDWHQTADRADVESLRSLRDLHLVISEVERFRNSKDPLIAGPAPADPFRRKAWERVRGSQLRDLHGNLDALRNRLQRGHGLWMEDQEWPSRLVSCVTACQRHFDERILYGEKQAINYDLAANQWDRILVAGTALERLVDSVAKAPTQARNQTPN